MLIPESKIEEIRERIDLVAVVTRHGVELKKSGRSLKGCCPFHQEKTPSFYVWPDTRRYKCFGCQSGGDCISFVQRLLGKTFVDTVRDLAREAGVDLEAAVDPAQIERAQIKEATDYAAQFYREHLWAPGGAQARAYLESRGVTDDVAQSFGLGWAPAEWSALADGLRERGFLSFGEKAGLVAPRTKGEGYYDMFRGRLMIPIRGSEGRTLGFGGRLLVGEDGPKYLNSRESKLYNKSDILYGIDAARDEIRKKKAAVLCEGYFDCIGMHQAGIKNAVALCSTALTPGHLKLLARHESKEIILLLDGDEAGRKAVERLAPALVAEGVPTKVAVLPEGEDPDTYARKVGSAAVAKLIAEAAPLTRHLFDTVLPSGAQASFEEKMMALERIKPVAAPLPVGLTRSAFFSALSSHFGIPAAELESGLRGKAPAVRPAPKPLPEGQASRPKPAHPTGPPDAFELLFAAAVARDRRLLARDTFHVADELRHPGLRALVAAIAGGTAPEEAVHESSESLRAALAKSTLPDDAGALDLAFGQICRRLKLRHIDEELKRITRETSAAPGAGELTDEVRELLMQRTRLLELKREVTASQP